LLQRIIMVSGSILNNLPFHGAIVGIFIKQDTKYVPDRTESL